MAFNKIGDEVKAHLLGLFSSDSSSPAPKRSHTEKNAGSAGSDSSKRELTPVQMPFRKAEADWLKNALGDTFAVFGEHVETRIQGVEAEMVTLNDKVVHQDKEIGILKEHTKQLKEELQAVMTVKEAGSANGQGVRAQPASAGRSFHNNYGPAVPYDERTIARMGNLGWNDPPEVILQRAREVLGETGFSFENYDNLTAVSRKAGSCAELKFPSAAKLKEARLAVQALNKSYVSEKWVWLDAKKEFHELRPARLVHRIYDVLVELESTREDKLKVEKVLNGKFVKLGDRRAGYTLHGQWKWTGVATQRYCQEDLDMARSFAEQD